MLVQVNTGRHLNGSEDLNTRVQDLVERKLRRFAERITRVEVHLNDENTPQKSGSHDKRCQIEVRLAGMQPASVSHHSETHERALDGAVDKIQHLLSSTLGKQASR